MAVSFSFQVVRQATYYPSRWLSDGASTPRSLSCSVSPSDKRSGPVKTRGYPHRSFGDAVFDHVEAIASGYVVTSAVAIVKWRVCFTEIVGLTPDPRRTFSLRNMLSNLAGCRPEVPAAVRYRMPVVNTMDHKGATVQEFGPNMMVCRFSFTCRAAYSISGQR